MRPDESRTKDGGGLVHGNPLYHWIALGIASVLLLPLSTAILRGWVPPWMRNRTGGLRLRAFGLLCLYAGTPANGVPRLADASYNTVMAGIAVGIGCSALAGLLFILAAGKDARVPR
ncbi:hypothetical protein [Streptomyces tailanensis]|uniref:hypothetical protein n=1 Tax=Streptomyces tailanensis TaxID=2569858 RepID=UPI00122E487B|nr:hypothetical protein [Streptomyces tailanensis]